MDNDNSTNCHQNQSGIGLPSPILHNESIDTSTFWNISMNNNHFGQRAIVERKISEDSVENLSAILISILRKEFSKDEDMQKFLNYWLIFQDHFSLFEKYFSEELRKNIDQIKSIFYRTPDLSLFYYFRQNLLPSLIGSADDQWNKNKFEVAVKWLHSRYVDHLVLKQKIDNLKSENIKNMELVCRLCKQCFNVRFQHSIKVLFLEKFTKIECLRKILNEKTKESKQSFVFPNTKENLRQEYHNMVIENHQLEVKLSELRQRKHRLESMDQMKVQHLKELLDKIRFVELLNQSPNADIDANPTATNTINCKNNKHFDSPISFDDDPSSLSRLSLSFDHQLEF